MDINQESCTNMFTAGQASRMDASLNLFYPQLLTSNGCLWNAINKNEMESVHVYPNPSNGIFRVETRKRDLISFSLIDISSRVVKQELISEGNNFEIDLSLLQTGIYFLYIKNKYGLYSMAKLLKF